MEISNIIPKPKSIPAFCNKKYPPRLQPWSQASLCSISGTLEKRKKATFKFSEIPEIQISFSKDLQDSILTLHEYVGWIYRVNSLKDDDIHTDSSSCHNTS